MTLGLHRVEKRPRYSKPAKNGDEPMINGGNATVFVSDMDQAVDFYTRVLGLELRMRADNHWAEVVAGNELVIGLHPASSQSQSPGTAGSIQIGFTVTEDLEEVQRRLKDHGIAFEGEIVDDGPGRFAQFKDPDGNQLYFWQQLAGAGSSKPE